MVFTKNNKLQLKYDFIKNLLLIFDSRHGGFSISGVGF
jgi:hypothetical protein